MAPTTPSAVDGRAAASSDRPTEDDVLAAVREAIRGIEYGSVLVKIHQGRVVAIETSTKVRLGPS